MADIIRELEKEQLRTDLPKLEVGDTVRVFVKVIEGSRERLQNFEGVVIKIRAAAFASPSPSAGYPTVSA